jgi:hypothetical protein
MSRFNRCVQVFSLFLAVFVITAHAVIPHDHHLSASFSGGLESCPAKNSKTSHHPGFPVHCHSFNILTSEKVIINFVPDKNQHKDLVISRLLTSFFDHLQLTSIKVNETWESFPDPRIIGFSQLRAPPAIC